MGADTAASFLMNCVMKIHEESVAATVVETAGATGARDGKSKSETQSDGSGMKKAGKNGAFSGLGGRQIMVTKLFVKDLVITDLKSDARRISKCR